MSGAPAQNFCQPSTLDNENQLFSYQQVRDYAQFCQQLQWSQQNLFMQQQYYFMQQSSKMAQYNPQVVSSQQTILNNHILSSTSICLQDSNLVKEEHSVPQQQMISQKLPVSLSIAKEEIVHKSDIEQILIAFVQHQDNNNKELSEIKNQLKDKSLLNQIFELIKSRYLSQKKGREEIIKFIMRKALKYLFGCVQQNQQGILSLKSATKICLDHYFSGMDADFQVLILPFRKDSKIKTMNYEFLGRVFACPEFANDYQIFLNNFEEIMMRDNQKKISNISKNIQTFCEKNTLQKVKTMRRMPWTVSSLNQGKLIAEQLLLTHGVVNIKKIKKIAK